MIYLPDYVLSLVVDYVTDGEPGRRARCRFCLRPSRNPTNIIAPCKCTGNMRGAHRGCLKNWIRRNAEERESGRCTSCGVMWVDVADDWIEQRWYSARRSHEEWFEDMVLACTAVAFALIMALSEFTFSQALLHDGRGAGPPRHMRAVAHCICETTDGSASRACLMSASMFEIAVVFITVLVLHVLVLRRYRPPRVPIPRAIIDAQRV
jgi:RING-variant domain